MKKMQLNKGRSGGLRLLSILLAIVLLCGLVVPGGALVMNTYADEVTPDVGGSEDVAPASETPVDETPADETPADETPADETPADETPADETPADETPVDETPADETPADKTPTDEMPVDEVNPVDELFNRLMAYQTYDELGNAMDAMTDEEYVLLSQFSDEQNTALSARVAELQENEAVVYAGSVTVEAGSSATCTDYNNVWSINSDYRVSPDTSGITLSASNNRIVVNVASTVPAGTYTVSGTYRNNRWNDNSSNFTITVTVTSSSVDLEGTIKVYVYVASHDSAGNSWKNNEEFQDLIGLYACDKNGYFPAGVIELDASYLNGKSGYNTPGSALINSNADWTKLLTALSAMDTSSLTGTYGVDWSSGETENFSENRGNKVYEYLSQASKDLNQVWGSQKSALFRWHLEPVANTSTASLGFEDQSVKYHLDLCFNTNKITFITGDNGIDSGIAKDGTEVDNRVYITGSEIQEPKKLTIPDGYQFMGYYEDAKMTIPWNGIGTPLNEDQVVYIKITEKDNVILQYVVAEGAGTVSLDSEGVNPDTGVAKGSTATAGDGYTFEGWYADEACTERLSENATFVPTKPTDGPWVAATYYAKFVPANTTITLDKNVTGNLGDWTKEFTFTVKYGETTEKYYLNHNDDVATITVPIGAEVTITESENSGYEVSATVDSKAVTVTNSAITFTTTNKAGGHAVVFTNNKEATIDTGVLLDTLPYVLILVVAGAGIAAMVIRKRRVTDED